MQPALNILRSMPARGRVTLAVAALAAIVVPFVLFKVATQPSLTTLAAGLDPAQTGKVTAALDERGIKHELRSNGTAIAVDTGQVAQARIALAEQGLPRSGQPGFELFDKHKLGTSDFQQKVDYERALEGEIARTIGQIDGVSGAQVQLVLPEDQLFRDEASPATAAVLLAGDASSLDPANVRGIAQLVASSVKGLKPDQVTITDGAGAMLWPRDDAASGEGGGAGGKLAAERRFETQLDARLAALLTQTVGAGKGQATSNVDLNVDQATRDRLEYDRRGVPQRETEEDERLRGTGAPAGAAGVTGNVPGYAQGAGGGRSDYRNRKSQTDWALNKTVTRTKIAPGSINRLDVAVLLDQTVPPAQVEALEEALTGAAGIDAARGDTISVQRVAFAAPQAPPADKAPVPAYVADYGKWVALGLGSLLFAFFVMRHLRRRERESVEPEPTWLREITTPMPLAAIEAETSMLGPASAGGGSRQALEEIAKDDPERLAAHVRSLMRDG